MAVVKWSPLADLGFRDLDRFFEEDMVPFIPAMPRMFEPALDIYQTKNSVVVETPLAGVDPKDVKVTIEDDILTVEGEVKKKTEVKEKDYYRREVKRGFFRRSVAMPVAVKKDKANAESEDGILKITIPKAEVKKPKQIAVKIKKK